jgi:hypothetical protein
LGRSGIGTRRSQRRDGEEPVPEMSGKEGDELVPEGVIEGAERNWNQGRHGREREQWCRGWQREKGTDIRGVMIERGEELVPGLPWKKERNGTRSVRVEKERNWYQGYHGREGEELVAGVSRKRKRGTGTRGVIIEKERNWYRRCQGREGRELATGMSGTEWKELSLYPCSLEISNAKMIGERKKCGG